MKREFQVLVFGEENDILSSQSYDTEPNEEILDELLSEGTKLQCYEIEGDEYSKLLFTLKK
jgi:hypothetical protein